MPYGNADDLALPGIVEHGFPSWCSPSSGLPYRLDRLVRYDGLRFALGCQEL
jgi:hypothetical protein